MKKFLGSLIAAILLIGIVPAFAVTVGEGVDVTIETEDFEPLIWLCGDRVVLDDNVEPGRITSNPEEMTERKHNYAFEGEQIVWDVLVMDKNGIEKIEDVFATIGSVQGIGNDIEANCVLKKVLTKGYKIDTSCDARIGEEKLTTAPADNMMAEYECTFTVETPDSMYGEYWVTIEVMDLDGLSNVMDENEYWFLNPIIALTIDGAIDFENVRPGTTSYSDTLLVGNDADAGSGVMLDMFISGTDFYDSASSGAKCPTTNQLALTNFRYFATSGAYSSFNDARAKDAESYVGINYGDHFETGFYGNNEIIQTIADPTQYSNGNVLSPGAEIALTFKLNLPEPCNGDFDTGSIYFWGEAV